MNIIEINEVTNYAILTQIGYILGFGAMILAFYTATRSNTNSSTRKKTKILFNIAFGMVAIGMLLGVIDFYFGEKKIQYEAVITEVEEVEKNGYVIVEHKDDDVYILEKIKKE